MLRAALLCWESAISVSVQLVGKEVSWDFGINMEERPVTVKLVPPKSGPMGPNIISELVPLTKYNMLTGPRRTNNMVPPHDQ